MADTKNAEISKKEKYVLLKLFKNQHFSKFVILKCSDYQKYDFTKSSKSGNSKKFPGIQIEGSNSVYVGYRIKNVTGE